MTQPTPPDPRTPISRLGPRPLGLHLTVAQSMWLSSLAALPPWKTGLPGWKPNGPLGELLQSLGPEKTDPFASAVTAELRARSAAFLTGLERYRHHPYRRDVTDPAALWSEDDARLLDYGGTAPVADTMSGAAAVPGGAGGRPVLFVPSLVNRGYILDLSARTSLMRWMAAQGFRPLLLDWGRPGEADRHFTLTDYVAGRLERALDAAIAQTGGPMPVVGYCMGGLFVAALAQRRPKDVSAAVFMATPWDFHAAQAATVDRLVAAMTPLLPLIRDWGELPVDGIQTLFAGLDPLMALTKFTRFARLDPASAKAEAFVALEDWLNDGIPLAGPVAEECITGWYGENTPANGAWTIAGSPIDPTQIHQPTLHLIPQQDRIVPPESARALAAAMPDALQIDPPLGHIGMVVAGRAPQLIWQALADWLAEVR